MTCFYFYDIINTTFRKRGFNERKTNDCSNKNERTSGRNEDAAGETCRPSRRSADGDLPLRGRTVFPAVSDFDEIRRLLRRIARLYLRQDGQAAGKVIRLPTEVLERQQANAGLHRNVFRSELSR